nr:hypothetical protein [Corynebacterium sp. UBA5992]
MSLRLPPESRCVQVLSLVLASTLFLSACSRDKEHESSILTPGETTTAADQGDEDTAAGSGAEQEQQADTLGQVRQAYAAVLDNPDSYTYNYETPPSSYSLDKYEYTIVEATGDGRPELLLKKSYREFSPVIVATTASHDPAGVVTSKDVLLEGAAGAGGTRLRIPWQPFRGWAVSGRIAFYPARQTA